MLSAALDCPCHRRRATPEAFLKNLAATAVGILAGCFVMSVAALAQETRVNIRGTIASFDGKVLTVKSKAAGDVAVEMPEAAVVSVTKPFSMADVKPGMILGVTTIKRADGATVAIDVRPIPAAAPLGLSPWDLAPEAVMTNAVVEGAVAASNGQALTLNYKSGTVTALVVPETAMSQAAPGSRDDLKPGETVFVFARKSATDALVAARVQVSKDGVKPTQ